MYQPYHVFSSTELAKQRRGLESIVTENEEKRPYRKNVLSSSSNQIAKHQENYLERQLEVVFRLTAHDNTAQLPVVCSGVSMLCLELTDCVIDVLCSMLGVMVVRDISLW